MTTTTTTTTATDTNSGTAADLAAPAAGPVMADLGRDLLAAAPGLEVVTSHVQLPPNFRLPPHTHPGEEFAYVIQGSIRFWQEGRDEVELTAGSTGTVPLGAVHTVRTTDEGATLVVFRVHEVGRPERTLVDVEPA